MPLKEVLDAPDVRKFPNPGRRLGLDLSLPGEQALLRLLGRL